MSGVEDARAADAAQAALLAECAEVDRWLDGYAEDRRAGSANRTLALARAEGAGIFDRLMLPPHVRPVFEDCTMACMHIGAMQGLPPQMIWLLMRVAFHVARTVARVEKEATG